MLRQLKKFWKSTASNFAVYFAVAAVPLFGAAGLAIDYSRMVSTEAKIQNAADAAVLAASRKALDLILDGSSEDDAFAEAESWGQDFFAANATAMNVPQDAEFEIELERDGGVIRGTGLWKGELETTLLAAVGSDIANLKVVAQASAGASNSFVELHFVVDASASMGVGATSGDHSIMASSIGCAFACHVPSGTVYWGGSTHDAARAAGATLRIDIVKEAISEMVDELAGSGFSGNQLHVALHSFSNNLVTSYAAGSDVSEFKSRLAAMDLVAAEGEGGTNFHRIMNQLELVVPNNGTGSDAGSRKVFVVFVTDGVATIIAYNRYASSGIEFEADSGFVPFAPYFNGSGEWSMQGFDPAICNDLKNDKNANLMTLNVRYIVPHEGTDNDTRFAEIESYLAPDIADHMRSCASDPSKAFWADTPDQIHDAMEEIRDSLISTLNPRLSS